MTFLCCAILGLAASVTPAVSLAPFLFSNPITMNSDDANAAEVIVRQGDHLPTLAARFCTSHAFGRMDLSCAEKVAAGLLDKYNRKRRDLLFEKLHAHRKREIMVVQIGAMDGTMDDPIFEHLTAKHGWRGLIVEPLPDHFATLQQNYGTALRKHGRDERDVAFANVAIGASTSPCTMRRVAPGAVASGAVPAWAAGTSTLLVDCSAPGGCVGGANTLRENPLLLPHCVSENVACLTLADLLAQHAVNRIDILIIDAEGWDYFILRQAFDFLLAGSLPAVVSMEAVHLSAKEKKQALALLQRHGYEVHEVVLDWIATRMVELVSWSEQVPTRLSFTSVA